MFIQYKTTLLARLSLALCVGCFSLGTQASSAWAQESHTIVLTPAPSKPTAFLYSAIARADVRIGLKEVEQIIQLQLRVVQGSGRVDPTTGAPAETISLELSGPGELIDVKGEQIASWAVRTADSRRFLDLQLKPTARSEGDSGQEDSNRSANTTTAILRIRNEHAVLPARIELAHLMPGKALGFDSQIEIHYDGAVAGKIVAADGFAPLVSNKRIDRLQTATGGRLEIQLSRNSALKPIVELLDTTLLGELDPSGKSVRCQLRGTVTVSVPDSRLRILEGNIAISQLPQSPDYRLELLNADSSPVFELVFAQPGSFPIAIDFVAAIKADANQWQTLNFTVAASAVVPVRLVGLDSGIEFARDPQALVPMFVDKEWRGFLPATGQVMVRWQNARSTVESKPFFTTNAIIEATVGPGLLRQEHRISYQLLQGQLTSLAIDLVGPGEILSVEGDKIVGWKVVGEGDQRLLELSLNQPLTGNSQITVRSQTPLGAFPVRVAGLSLQPQGAIRHSGNIRISNSGSVSVEPTALRGLTQLAPEQFPGEPLQSRQLVVYRFPSADYGFTIVADRVQPEINVTHLVLYQLSESDRVIAADIELDIREATIREWNFKVPADYSIVAVTGASVSDYMASAEPIDGTRNLKVLFGQDVQGRHLIGLRLEKNEVATTGQWNLPHLLFPDAKTVRGDIGIVAAAGYRATVGTIDLLVEKPLSYFPRPVPNLQQAFRIREPDWKATIQIEQLERSIQSDVFHQYSLSQGTVYGSALVNYTVTGAPVAEWQLTVPAKLGNVTVDGREIRNWRRESDTLVVSLQQPILGAYTLLVTFEEKPNVVDGSFQAGLVAPLGVQGDRGYVEVVSPVQVEMETLQVSSQLLVLDPLELPGEFRLLSTAPTLGTWQYTQRPFELKLKVNWFDPGTTAAQVVEFSEANSRVSQDGDLVTDIVYYVKSRGQRTLKLQLPREPVRLWAVSVDGRPVSARQAGDETLIPLPGGADPNAAVEVSVRLGRPTSDRRRASIALPTVFAPVLKTQWNVTADENHVLIPSGGNVEPTIPVLWPNGFEELAARGLSPLIGLAVLALAIAWTRSVPVRLFALTIAVAVAGFACWYTIESIGTIAPLQLSLPVLASGETVHLEVSNIPSWRAFISWPGVAIVAVGMLIAIFAYRSRSSANGWFVRAMAWALIAIGVLMQPDGAPWFFGLMSVAIFVFWWVPETIQWNKHIAENKGQGSVDSPSSMTNEMPLAGGNSNSVVTTSILAFAIGISVLCFPNPLYATALQSELPSSHAVPVDADGIVSASSLVQKWSVSHRDKRLSASAEMILSGRPGDRFVLLSAPAVLTQFDGAGLRLGKVTIPNQGVAYVVTIPGPEIADEKRADDDAAGPAPLKQYTATFAYQLEAVQSTAGIPVLTGAAALQQIDLSHDEPNWEVVCASAARIDPMALEPSVATAKARVRLLLGPGRASIILRPQTRDLTIEATQFFVEGAGLYTPGPGVIDGKHRLKIRASQGRVNQLSLVIPAGLTVSSVDGPVASWQFDADKSRLQLQIGPTASSEFTVTVDTQRSLDALPTTVQLAPVRVEGAGGEVGLIALAFGSEAQPENVQADGLSLVNLGDFDSSMLTNKQTTLHRVYRYSAEGGSLSVQVSPVAPEVRVTSKQVVSFGDERIVLGLQFVTEISRTGLFQLSFPLPTGFEVESLSGDALHHWSELTENSQRQIVLHLKGKTIGAQKFALTLAGTAPTDATQWSIPRFEINEATRQSGELVVQPITGIRLRTITRQNVSEADPRSLGAQGQGALAFRLLQREWSLQLGIEKLAPWVTGQVLHDVTLREGQTRSSLMAEFTVQNAAIRTLSVKLPAMGTEEIKTIRAHGETVSDFVRSAQDESVWELRFKRRVIGPVQFQIEYERRGDRAGDRESLSPVDFPDARQLGYHFAVRSGGRLEMETGTLTQGWQLSDWSTVPQPLRDAGNRNAPALSLRANSPTTPLSLKVIRHSLADALKLRVSSGELTTVLSPTGDQLTSVEVNMEVIQRSSLSVQLPQGGELFSIFVNGESVHSIRQKNGSNTWQFYILPGMDDRTAQVRFVYSLIGDNLKKVSLVSPQLNVPLENIVWNVIAPIGFELIHSQGNLEWVGHDRRALYDRESYLSNLRDKRKDQAQQASDLLVQANKLLQTGEQTKAQWALSNVANRHALDAASNEDARVQLENLQTQQAILGLNTRRQRLFLDSNRGGAAVSENEQLRQAAAINPILQQEQLHFRPQELSQLLAGNSKEDNAILKQIAGRLVQHQRTSEPAPQAIVITLPEEGNRYRFQRSVQVAENTPMELELQFHSQYKLRAWQWIVLAGLVGILVMGLARSHRSP